MRLEPFQYQLEGIQALRDGFKAGKNRGLLVMLMGAGKSVLAMELMRLTSERGNRCLFLCDRRMLADQAVEVAKEQGLDAGILMANRGSNMSALCQFASKQSLLSWLKKGLIELPDFKLVVTDEAHRATSDTWLALHRRWPNAFHIGLTATPCLGNGNGLGAYYDFLIQPIKPSGLRELNRIVPVRAFAPHIPNLKGVRNGKDGDYAASGLSKVMTRANLIGDVCGWWKRLAENRPSIYFGCDVAHALAIRDEFVANGVTAEMICDETADDERKTIRENSKTGETKVVVNCDVLAEGIDWPWISCIGLVRPTKRLRRYLQNAGRGLRACEGKMDLLILDHAGCVLYHGMPDIDRDWSIDPCDNIDAKSQQKPPTKGMIRCSNCSALFSGSRTCPECGHTHVEVKTAKDYATKNGTLVEVNGGDMPQEAKKLLQQRFWGTCVGVAIKRRAKAGMAAGMFSQKFGIPPWEAGVSPLPDGRGAWQRPACDVFPGFIRGQKPSKGDSYEG